MYDFIFQSRPSTVQDNQFLEQELVAEPCLRREHFWVYSVVCTVARCATFYLMAIRVRHSLHPSNAIRYVDVQSAYDTGQVDHLRLIVNDSTVRMRSLTTPTLCDSEQSSEKIGTLHRHYAILEGAKHVDAVNDQRSVQLIVANAGRSVI